MDPTELQFERLTRLILDGIASDSDRAELSRLSVEHPELLTSVVDDLMIDALLKWQSGSIIEELPPLEGSIAISQAPRTQKSGKRIRTWFGMIAATLLIVGGVAAWKLAWVGAGDCIVADIVNRQQVTWSDDSTALASDNTVRCGLLSSTGGGYTLQFRGGSTVRVVGEASLDIKSKMLVQLNHGQATANISHDSPGFTITSAVVDVVDQGTEFDSVNNGGADVVVFDGKVDVKSKLDQSGSKKRLTQGHAVTVDRKGVYARLADIRRDVDGRWWSNDRSKLSRQVIASVSDNIHANGGGGDDFFCYQTTFEGLHEDAIAYSDNPYHQWNGLTADGMPDFLRGADYIRTFNDYRYMEYFEMKIELAQPANLYVFFDDRVDPPDWLKANFENTGVDIGLDEGPWLLQADELNQVDRQKFRELDANKTAAGGGNSIDNIFSVWRRRCVDGGTVTLGNAGPWGSDRIGVGGKGGRAMYGVAATPLDAEDLAH